LKKAEIIAISYGTPIGIVFSNKFPEFVSHLVLIGTMKKFPPHMIIRAEHTVSLLRRNQMQQFADEVLDCIMNYYKENDINRFDVIRRILYRNLENMNKNEQTNYIENTRRLLYHREIDENFNYYSPALVFTGEYDCFTKPEYCREIAWLFEKAIFTTVKNADHLCNIEQFDLTNNLIECFLLNKDLKKLPGCNKVESNYMN
jgi:pimeloyl-ACP methyl ester carboxylesterase